MAATLAQDVGWLLANARQHSGVEGVRTAAGFARAGPFEEVHRSAVVRWEHGTVPITHETVRRYETVLELPYGQLLSAVEYLAASTTAAAAPPSCARPGGRPTAKPLSGCSTRRWTASRSPVGTGTGSPRCSPAAASGSSAAPTGRD